jgi:hypothetical protein
VYLGGWWIHGGTNGEELWGTVRYCRVAALPYPAYKIKKSALKKFDMKRKITAAPWSG